MSSMLRSFPASQATAAYDFVSTDPYSVDPPNTISTPSSDNFVIRVRYTCAHSHPTYLLFCGSARQASELDDGETTFRRASIELFRRLSGER